jgi:hypothetical protein
MSYKYKATFKDIENKSYTLEIYKNYSDTIKEVILSDSPVIKCKTPDTIIDGGLCTTSCEFSLLGTNTDDLMCLALSELTDYKVIIKRESSLLFFGYLINGVYEVDFSEYTNFSVQFAASDFKVLEKTKGCTSGLTTKSVRFKDLFVKSCLYNDFKDVVTLNITTSTITVENATKVKNYPTENTYPLTDNIYIEKLVLFDEKGLPLSDYRIFDDLLKQYGYVLMQYMGELHLYEPSQANNYNDYRRITLNEYNPTVTLVSGTSVAKWSTQPVSRFYGKQNLTISSKIDRFVIKPDRNYKDNYATAELRIDDKSYKSIYEDGNHIDVWGYIHQQTPSEHENQFILRVLENQYNTSQFIDGGCMYMIMTNDDSSYPTKSTNYAAYGTCILSTHQNGKPMNSVSVVAGNTFNYNDKVAVGLNLRLKFDSYYRYGSLDDIKSVFGKVKLYVTTDSGEDVLLETRSYINKTEAGGNIDKKYLRKMKTYEKDKTREGKYEDGYSDEFIFSFANATNSILSDFKVEFEQPTTADNGTSSAVLFWGVNNVRLDLVVRNSFGRYETYEEEEPQQLIIESNGITNNLAEEESFDYAYVTNEESYPLLKNTMYEYSASGKVTCLSKVTNDRTARITYTSSSTLELLKINSLFKQLNVRRNGLDVEIKNDYNTSPTKLLSICSIPNKEFIISNYSLDIVENTIGLTIEEHIK